MPKQEGQKTKLLALLHIFEQKTDENHLLNVPQLVELLEQQGILAERKSIYSDIDTLCALGYDIQLRRGRGGAGGSKLAGRGCNRPSHAAGADGEAARRVAAAGPVPLLSGGALPPRLHGVRRLLSAHLSR